MSLRSVDERQAFFGPKFNWRQIRVAQHRSRRTARVASFQRAFADERECEMCQRSKIAARAHAALLRNRRIESRVQHFGEEIGEIDFGEWTGRTFDELASDTRWMQFNRVRSTAVAPGGESLAGVQQRFVGAMRTWARAYPESRIALFSHADPIKTALAHYLDLPLDLFDRLEVGLGSISVVEADAGGGRVIRLNEIPAAFAA